MYKARINHKFGDWKRSDILTTTNSWNHFVQSSTGSLFSKSKEAYYYMSAESSTQQSAIYKNDRRNLTRTLHFPEDCIPTSLRLNIKRNILIATISYTKPTVRAITHDLPHDTFCVVRKKSHSRLN
jgi:hypothetical protein